MGHWYDAQGNPVYEIIGANGKLRDTTLRDARKHNYAPSTTTIIGEMASPGLANYLQNQIIDACIAYPFDFDRDDEGYQEQWRKIVVGKSKEHANNAASKGTAIHNALEHYYSRGELTEDMREICNPVIELLTNTFGTVQWQPERSFTHGLGFGGKVDMSLSSLELSVVLDFKTKDTNDIKKMIPYDVHHMQTASYALGLGIPNAKRYNLFISTQEPGLITLTESTDFERDWGMFEALLKLWQLKNNYKPDL